MRPPLRAPCHARRVTLGDIVTSVAGLPDVHVQRAAPGDGSPEIAWGDVFFSYAPEGAPVGQPFATITTKDYPGEPASGLDRPGAFRLNVQTTQEVLDRLGPAPVDPSEADELAAHPIYAGWLTVTEPGQRTSEQALQLLRASHAAAAERSGRRSG